MIYLDGKSLTLPQVVEVARHGEKVALSEAGIEQIGRRVLSGVGKYGDINLKYSELERKVKDTAYSRKSPDNTVGKVGEFVAPVLLPGGPGLQGAKILSKQGAKQPH